MVLQEISADYIPKAALLKLLNSKFGPGNYSYQMRGPNWVVEVPDYISDYEINQAQEG